MSSNFLYQTLSETAQISHEHSSSILEDLLKISLASTFPVMLMSRGGNGVYRIEINSLKQEENILEITINYFRERLDYSEIKISFQITDENYDLGLKETLDDVNTVVIEAVVITKIKPFNSKLC